MREQNLGSGQLFEPDVLLPSQFFSHLQGKLPQEPEYRLVVALLQDAIDCFHKHAVPRDAKARELFDETAEWITSDDRQWPFSFLNVCDLLRLNPHYVRGGLDRWRHNQRGAGRGRRARSAGIDDRDVCARAS